MERKNLGLVPAGMAIAGLTVAAIAVALDYDADRQTPAPRFTVGHGVVKDHHIQAECQPQSSMITSARGESRINYAVAAENLETTLMWMQNHRDRFVNTTPNAIKPYLWTAEDLKDNRYVVVEPVDVGGARVFKAVISSKKFEKDLTPEETRVAAEQLLRARILIGLVSQNEYCDQERFRQLAAQIEQMPFSLPLYEK